MSYIKNIVKDDFEIEFDINNGDSKILPSLVNGLRRTLISDIPTWCIDGERVLFLENTSVMDNEFLAHRLSMVPVRCDLKDIDYDSIFLKCSKRNENDELEGVYVRDIEVLEKKSGNLIENGDFFPYPDILLVKLRLNQSVSFEGKLELNSVSNGGGSIHSPVSSCVHTFKVDENKVREKTKNMSEEQKVKFDVMDKEREYIKNDREEPGEYTLKFESLGFYKPDEVVQFGLVKLMERLDRFYTDLVNKNERVEIYEGDVFPDILNIVVHEDSDTLGNLISSYTNLKPNVAYAGYVIRHPLRKNVLMKFKLKEDNTEEKIIELIGEVIGEIKNILISMLKVFSKK